MKTALFEAHSSAAQFQKPRRSVIFYRFIVAQKELKVTLRMYIPNKQKSVHQLSTGICSYLRGKDVFNQVLLKPAIRLKTSEAESCKTSKKKKVKDRKYV